MRSHELRLPDLGLGAAKIVTSAWLSDVGTRVYEGDRLLEVHCGAVTVDLPSPATGVLVEQRVAEEDELTVGQVLGVVDEQ
jgi:2-oxoglutarate dehydrogenase E2 component (dihydrolipoamide succinyltransferase)